MPIRLFALALGIAAVAPSQELFERAGGEHLVDRALLRWTGDMELVDLDGDGRRDLVISDVGLSTGWTELWTFRNVGAGRLTLETGRVRPGFSSRGALAIGDIDGDGDPDITFDSSVYTNNGRGGFISKQALATSANVAAAFGDVDGDGDLDLLQAGFSQSMALLRNNGAGRFGASTQPLTTPRCDDFVLADVDNDGDLDVVTAPVFAPPTSGAAVFLNDGAGGFTQLSSTGFPTIRDEVLEIEAGDVDGDGDVDLLIGTDRQDLVYINVGGRFINAGPLEPGLSAYTVRWRSSMRMTTERWMSCW